MYKEGGNSITYGKIYNDNWTFDPGRAKGYFTKGDVGKKAATFTPKVQAALQGSNIGSMSQENSNIRTEAARPQVVASPPMQGSGSSSVSASGGSSSTRPRTDHTQALVQRQTSGS